VSSNPRRAYLPRVPSPPSPPQPPNSISASISTGVNSNWNNSGAAGLGNNTTNSTIAVSTGVPSQQPGRGAVAGFSFGSPPAALETSGFNTTSFQPPQQQQQQQQQPATTTIQEHGATVSVQQHKPAAVAGFSLGTTNGFSAPAPAPTNASSNTSGFTGFQPAQQQQQQQQPPTSIHQGNGATFPVQQQQPNSRGVTNGTIQVNASRKKKNGPPAAFLPQQQQQPPPFNPNAVSLNNFTAGTAFPPPAPSSLSTGAPAPFSLTQQQQQQQEQHDLHFAQQLQQEENQQAGAASRAAATTPTTKGMSPPPAPPQQQSQQHGLFSPSATDNGTSFSQQEFRSPSLQQHQGPFATNHGTSQSLQGGAMSPPVPPQQQFLSPSQQHSVGSATATATPMMPQPVLSPESEVLSGASSHEWKLVSCMIQSNEHKTVDDLTPVLVGRDDDGSFPLGHFPPSKFGKMEAFRFRLPGAPRSKEVGARTDYFPGAVTARFGMVHRDSREEIFPGNELGFGAVAANTAAVLFEKAWTASTAKPITNKNFLTIAVNQTGFRISASQVVKCPAFLRLVEKFFRQCFSKRVAKEIAVAIFGGEISVLNVADFIEDRLGAHWTVYIHANDPQLLDHIHVQLKLRLVEGPVNTLYTAKLLSRDDIEMHVQSFVDAEANENLAFQAVFGENYKDEAVRTAEMAVKKRLAKRAACESIVWFGSPFKTEDFLVEQLRWSADTLVGISADDNFMGPFCEQREMLDCPGGYAHAKYLILQDGPGSQLAQAGPQHPSAVADPSGMGQLTNQLAVTGFVGTFGTVFELDLFAPFFCFPLLAQSPIPPLTYCFFSMSSDEHCRLRDKDLQMNEQSAQERERMAERNDKDRERHAQERERLAQERDRKEELHKKELKEMQAKLDQRNQAEIDQLRAEKAAEEKKYEARLRDLQERERAHLALLPYQQQHPASVAFQQMATGTAPVFGSPPPPISVPVFGSPPHASSQQPAAGSSCNFTFGAAANNATLNSTSISGSTSGAPVFGGPQPAAGSSNFAFGFGAAPALQSNGTGFGASSTSASNGAATSGNVPTFGSSAGIAPAGAHGLGGQQPPTGTGAGTAANAPFIFGQNWNQGQSPRHDEMQEG